MFLLVPAHPGCPGQIPQSRKTVVCVCVCVCVAAMHLLENPVFANAEHIFVVAFSALTLLLGGRKGIQPIKNSGGILAWLCVCVKVQICIWPS